MNERGLRERALISRGLKPQSPPLQLGDSPLGHCLQRCALRQVDIRDVDSVRGSRFGLALSFVHVVEEHALPYRPNDGVMLGISPRT